MTNFKQVADNAVSTTETDLSTIGVTSIVLSSGGGKFPVPGNGFTLTLWNSTAYPNPGDDPNMEKVTCTARSGNTLTVSPTTKTHSAVTTVGLLNVAANIAEIQAAVNTLETSVAGKEPTITASTNNKYFRGDKTFQTLDKTAVGLPNVPNVDATDRANHTGTQSADTIIDGTTNKAYTAAEKTKLAGVSPGATANDTDANLKSRANHTGTQLSTTISDFSTAADARVAAAAGNSVASLSGGKVPTSQLPAVSLTSVQTAASQAAMLALTTQEGDVVVRTDQSKTYMRNAGSAGDMTDFTLLNTPPDAVTSVNSQTGNVVLGKADVGLGNVDNTSDANKPVSTAQQTALNLKANTASLAPVATSGDYDDLTNKPTGAAAAWGSVTGTLSDQTDLEAALDAKLDESGGTMTGELQIGESTTLRTLTVDSYGSIDINAADLPDSGGAGGYAALNGGYATGTDADGGDVILYPGQGNGAGNNGKVKVYDPTSGFANGLDASALTADRTTSLPDKDGTIAYTDDITVDSVNGQQGAVVLAKNDVGLGNVDNTSDASKPISTATQTALNAKADLSGGKVPTSQLPAVSLTSVQTAASQAAQLALTTQEGDVVVRTDQHKTYMRNAGTAGDMTDYTLLDTPVDAVTSVNGQTGTVVLAKSDVGLGSVDNTADAAKSVASAAALTTARNIDGQSFNGTADVTVIAPGTHAATSKATPVDADELPLVDSAASNVLKKLTWANLKATAKTYFDTLYAAVTHTHAAADIASGTVATARLGSGTANSGTYLRGDQTWAAVAGGGQTTFDAIVASSGGTHTTLSAALTAASNGWRILVLDPVTESGAITCTLTNLEIHGAGKSALVTMGANNITFSGSNVALHNLGMYFTSGRLIMSNNYQKCDSCYFLCDSAGVSTFTFTGIGAIITQCLFELSYTGASTDNYLVLGGTGCAAYNNYFKVTRCDMSTNRAVVRMTSTGNVFSNNYLAVTTLVANGGNLIQTVGDLPTITNNTITYAGTTGGVAMIQNSSGNAVISNNNVQSGTFGIQQNGGSGVCNGNRVTVNGTSSAIGIYLAGGSGQVVSGNYIAGAGVTGSSNGVYVEAGDDHVISGNRITNFTTGVTVTASRNRVVVQANALNGCTNSVTDSGTGTIKTAATDAHNTV